MRTTGPTLLVQAVRAALKRAATPPFGTPDGIASLEQVKLNDYPQWVLLRGKSESNPLLLFRQPGRRDAARGRDLLPIRSRPGSGRWQYQSAPGAREDRPPPYAEGDVFVQRRWLSEYHGDLHDLDVFAFLSMILEAPEYTLRDAVRLLRGVKRTNAPEGMRSRASACFWSAT